MPIKSLESYLFERKLVNTSSIEILKNATIGIDVEHYLSRIYTFKKEQYLSAIGGVPTSLRDYIHSDLKVFKEFNIKPIFVVKGLDIQLQLTDLRTNELTTNEQHLENTWTKLNARNLNYSNSNNNDSFRLFTDPLPLRPMVNDLIKYFIEIGIDYIVAPYDASFQLSYLYQNKVIDTIYGSTELLLTKANKFILGMEFQSKDFRFIDKKKVLNELGITQKQLLDLSIMVGCSLQPHTFPNLPPLPKPNPLQPYPQLSYFKLALDILYQINQPDLYTYLLSLNDQRCIDLYFKGHSAFKFIPILNEEGYVSMYMTEMAKLNQLTDDDFSLFERKEKADHHEGKKNHKDIGALKVSNDVHDIISQRLPPEFYFYQSIGLAPLELLESITQGKLSIRPPLESGLSESYKKLINNQDIIDNLDSVFNLLTQLLNRYYQVKKIKLTYWYKTDTLELNNRMIPPVSRKINDLFVNSSEPDFNLTKFFINDLTNKKEPLKSNNEVISTSLLRTFKMLGIYESSYFKILKRFVTEQEGNLKNLEHLVILLMLIKTNSLKLNESQFEYSGVARYYKDSSSSEIKLEKDEMKHITLLSRIFSIHRFKIAPINYQGPISRNLLHFRSHLKFISSNLIYTLQSCLIDLIVRQENNSIKVDFNSKDEWYKLVDQIPFYQDLHNTLLGVISEIYFDYSVKQQKLNKDLTKDKIVENTKDHLLNTVFQIPNPIFNINVHGVNSITTNQLLHDFDEGVEFWKLFIELIKVANEVDKTVISDAYLKEILDTNEWMGQFV